MFVICIHVLCSLLSFNMLSQKIVLSFFREKPHIKLLSCHEQNYHLSIVMANGCCICRSSGVLWLFVLQHHVHFYICGITRDKKPKYFLPTVKCFDTSVLAWHGLSPFRSLFVSILNFRACESHGFLCGQFLF